ncbi:MAG: hypothetical protein K2L62_06720 [Muribaculaceae bacterium]|nr:hypothetical protein [Muribaculaceae bacterium]MDE6628967.1 hypothetical protein [Muribaculaceae bacterium]
MKKEILIPALLLIYLGAMMVTGFDSYRAGTISALSYFGGAALTLACIVLLHFNLKRTAARRRNRGDKNGPRGN